jgi:hypothetical protein
VELLQVGKKEARSRPGARQKRRTNRGKNQEVNKLPGLGKSPSQRKASRVNKNRRARLDAGKRVRDKESGLPFVISDREYSNYRASHQVVGVIDEDRDRVVVRTAEANEEEWIRPRWILNAIKRSKQTSG